VAARKHRILLKDRGLSEAEVVALEAEREDTAKVAAVASGVQFALQLVHQFELQFATVLNRGNPASHLRCGEV
jgi:hypothetical protein